VIWMEMAFKTLLLLDPMVRMSCIGGMVRIDVIKM